jgi:hypothetical protein
MLSALRPWIVLALLLTPLSLMTSPAEAAGRGQPEEREDYHLKLGAADYALIVCNRRALTRRALRARYSGVERARVRLSVCRVVSV